MANYNNSTILPAAKSIPAVIQINNTPGGEQCNPSASEKPTFESVRLHATKAAAAWNSNDDNLCVVATLIKWRDNCRDEIRDEILAEIEGCDAQEPLLDAWAKTFDGATGGEPATLRSMVFDARDEVGCAVDTACDLLCLAMEEGVRFEPQGNRANATIRAAMRYLEDIEEALDFIDGRAMADGGAA